MRRPLNLDISFLKVEKLCALLGLAVPDCTDKLDDPPDRSTSEELADEGVRFASRDSYIETIDRRFGGGERHSLPAIINWEGIIFSILQNIYKIFHDSQIFAKNIRF